MTRLAIPLLAILLLVLLVVASGTPKPVDNGDGSKSPSGIDVSTLTPIYIVKDSLGYTTQYIYEFDNNQGQHCTLVVDERNTTSDIDCQ